MFNGWNKRKENATRKGGAFVYFRSLSNIFGRTGYMTSVYVPSHLFPTSPQLPHLSSRPAGDKTFSGNYYPYAAVSTRQCRPGMTNMV